MWESFLSGAVFVLLLELIWADFRRLILCSGISEMERESASTGETPRQPPQMCLRRIEDNCLCFCCLLLLIHDSYFHGKINFRISFCVCVFTFIDSLVEIVEIS